MYNLNLITREYETTLKWRKILYNEWPVILKQAEIMKDKNEELFPIKGDNEHDWGNVCYLQGSERLHFHFSALEKEMATHSSVLAWRIPGMGVAESDTTEET